ncbi:hypothetical protein [Streptomyces sp. NPDC021139]|uniref:hypothetical protein n=1 Tax=unclassified Streptomyces TaxID=2593676 RepID=UPI0033ED2420
MIDLQGHRLSEPLRPDATLDALLGHADLAECAADWCSSSSIAVVSLDQNLLGLLGQRRAGLAALMCLSQEVSGGEALFGDPLTQERALAAVVRALQATKSLCDRG